MPKEQGRLRERRWERARAARKKLAMKDPKLSEWLSRQAHSEGRRMDGDLVLLEFIYNNNKHNPFAALEALAFCRRYRLPLDEWPEWVTSYLDASVRRLLELRPQTKKRREQRDPKSGEIERKAHPLLPTARGPAKDLPADGQSG